MSDGWQGLLEPDETIVWQGTPSSRVRVEWLSPFVPIFFVFFTGFSIFWMAMASQAGGFFWMFGLLFFGAGIFNLVGIHFWKAFRRSNTQYTLTNKRAFIGDRTFGRKTLQTYRILPETPLEFEEYANDGSIYFSEKVHRGRNGQTVQRIGFEMIPDARAVLGHLNKIQQDAAEMV